MAEFEGGRPSDEELISRSKEGDREAFGELYRRHSHTALRLAVRLAGVDRAGDLVHETFIKLMTRLESGVVPAISFRSYLLTSVRNLHIDHLRRSAGKERLTEDYSDVPPALVQVPDVAQERAEAAALVRAFRSLPEHWRIALWYSEAQGESLAEVAERLGSNANAVAAMTFRAREALRSAYLQEHLNVTARRECEPFVKMLSGLVRGTLARTKIGKLEKHLARCGDCSTNLAAMRKVDSRLERQPQR